tara:strand:- start:903 stop:1109 length:207 start_codon:yes stop_codon:yes gene_type:complete
MNLIDIIFIIIIIFLVINITNVIRVNIKKYRRLVNGWNNRVVPMEIVEAVYIENIPENSIIVDVVEEF